MSSWNETIQQMLADERKKILSLSDECGVCGFDPCMCELAAHIQAVIEDIDVYDVHSVPRFAARQATKKILESLTSNFEYGVTFYNSCDDGSHPYGDFKLRFNTPEEAHEYAESEVERMWQEMRTRHAQRVDADLDWFDKHVEREIYVVECYRKKGE